MTYENPSEPGCEARRIICSAAQILKTIPDTGRWVQPMVFL